MSLTQRNGLKSLYFEPCKYHIIVIDIVSFSSFTLLQQKRYLACLYEQLQLLCVSPALLRARISEKSITRILVCFFVTKDLYTVRANDWRIKCNSLPRLSRVSEAVNNKTDIFKGLCIFSPSHQRAKQYIPIQGDGFMCVWTAFPSIGGSKIRTPNLLAADCTVV